VDELSQSISQSINQFLVGLSCITIARSTGDSQLMSSIVMLNDIR